MIHATPEHGATAVNCRVLNDRILVLPDKKEEKSKGGVFYPDTHEEKEVVTGTVLAVGPGKWEPVSQSRAPMSVYVGDRIRMSPYGGSGIKIGEDEYLVVTEKDVLAVDL